MYKSIENLSNSQNNLSRFGEIDFLRGIAIILMISYHFVIDLYFLGISKIFLKPIFRYWNDASFNLFFFIVGVSLTISYRNNLFQQHSSQKIFLKNLKRGLKLLAWGMLITLITFFVFPREYIIFGTLHFIGCAIICSFPFLKFKNFNLIFIFLFFIIGNLLQTIQLDHSWLAPLGIHSKSYASIDYFPFFRTFPTVLLGILLGNYYYVSNEKKLKRKWSLSFHSTTREKILKILQPLQSINFLGKHSLLIYLLHQPIIYGLLLIYKILFLKT